MIPKFLTKSPILSLIIVLAVGFAFHSSYLFKEGLDLSTHWTWQAYVFNLIMASLVITVMLRLPAKFQANLGFVFMVGSALKFLAFFLIFFPRYKADGEIQGIEFSSFFIPYAICLSVKTFILLSRLKEA